MRHGLRATGYGLRATGYVSLLDPARPRKVEELPYTLSTFRETQSLAEVGGLLYIADPENGLFVLDPADPTRAELVLRFFGADRMVVDGNRLLSSVANAFGNLVFTALDISDPGQPAFLGSWSVGAMRRWNS